MAHLGHHTLDAQTDAAERVGAISDDRTPDTDGVLSSLYYLCACTSCHFAELYSIDRRRVKDNMEEGGGGWGGQNIFLRGWVGEQKHYIYFECLIYVYLFDAPKTILLLSVGMLSLIKLV